MKIIISNEAKIVSKNQVVDLHQAFKLGEVKETKHGFEFDKKSSVTASLGNSALDFQPLIKYASKPYNISDDPRDYAVIPVPIIISDVPNRNGVAFPAKALAQFAPDYGMPYFQTWKGKPTFEEHNNKDITKAKGLILDSVMNPVKNRPGFWKVVVLLAYDRTKDRICYEKITKGNSNAYSMGAYAGLYKCSICGSEYAPNEKPKCSHIIANKVNFYDLNGKLAYVEVWEPVGFETSRVDVPAYRMAISDNVNILDPEIRNMKR